MRTLIKGGTIVTAEQEFVDGSSIRNYDFTILRFAAVPWGPIWTRRQIV